MLAIVDRVLNYRLALALRIVVLAIAVAIPCRYVGKRYNADTGFTSLIFFGRDFAPGTLAEVKAVNHAADFPAGYDGQYYAQIAIKPLLNDPQLNQALDSPYYRAERIGLPVVAYLLGLGRPALILQVYAVLNLGFWLLLLAGMVFYLKPGTVKEYLCLLAAMFTTGSLVSIQRALTDLPAATFGFYGAAWADWLACGALAMAILTKQTSVFLLPTLAYPIPNDWKAAGRWVARFGIVMIPFVLWFIYVRHVLSGGTYVPTLFGWPLVGGVQYVREGWKTLRATAVVFSYQAPNLWEWRLFEVLAPISVMFQAIYLCVRFNPKCPYWRMGVGFAVLFLFFSTPLFATQIGFCRLVLPMTIAFNIQMVREKGPAFLACFVAGNVGLLFALREVLGYCVL